MKKGQEPAKKEDDSVEIEPPKTDKGHTSRPRLVKRPSFIRALDQLADSLESELKRLNHT